MNNRKSVLDEASTIVNGERANAYGGPEDSFKTIAGLWNAYFQYQTKGIPNIKAHDVALMLNLLKVARLVQSPDHRDSWVDMAGYAACGAECALPKKENGYVLPSSLTTGDLSSTIAGCLLGHPAQQGAIKPQWGHFDKLSLSPSVLPVQSGEYNSHTIRGSQDSLQKHLVLQDVIDEWVNKQKAQEAWKDVHDTSS